MRKIIIVPALLGAMGIGGVIAATGGNLIGSADSSNILSVNEIEKKALQVVDGRITDIELENEGKKKVYEVDMLTDDFEYDLKFDALTGELLKKKKEDRDDDLDDHFDDDDDDDQSKQVQRSTEQFTNNQATAQTNQPVAKQVNSNEQQTKQATNNTPRKLTVSEIKTKALSVVNGKIVEVDFDTDDGRSVYEVEIITNNAEYELKFDAYSGALLEKEVDDLDDDDEWDD